MSKLLSLVAILALVATFAAFAPTDAHAQSGIIGGNFATTCDIRNPSEIGTIKYDGTQTCGNVGNSANLGDAQAVCCVFDTIFTVTLWVFWFVMSIVILFVVIGAFYIITAGGSPDKVGIGRNFIVYAAIGALVAVAARAIPGIARAVMGV